MKAIVLTFLIFLMSCKLQYTKAQENTLKSTNSNSRLTEISQSSNPNTVILTAKIVLIYDKPVNICGESIKNVVSLKVSKITNAGQGIINPISIDSEYNMILSTTTKSPNSIKVGDLVKVEAVEKLCLNASDSKYFILNIE